MAFTKKLFAQSYVINRELEGLFGGERSVMDFWNPIICESMSQDGDILFI